MAKKKKKKPIYLVEDCGGRKRGGCSWGGATKGLTAIRIAA